MKTSNRIIFISLGFIIFWAITILAISQLTYADNYLGEVIRSYKEVHSPVQPINSIFLRKSNADTVGYECTTSIEQANESLIEILMTESMQRYYHFTQEDIESAEWTTHKEYFSAEIYVDSRQATYQLGILNCNYFDSVVSGKNIIGIFNGDITKESFDSLIWFLINTNILDYLTGDIVLSSRIKETSTDLIRTDTYCKWSHADDFTNNRAIVSWDTTKVEYSLNLDTKILSIEKTY